MQNTPTRQDRLIQTLCTWYYVILRRPAWSIRTKFCPMFCKFNGSSKYNLQNRKKYFPSIQATRKKVDGLGLGWTGVQAVDQRYTSWNAVYSLQIQISRLWQKSKISNSWSRKKWLSGDIFTLNFKLQFAEYERFRRRAISRIESNKYSVAKSQFTKFKKYIVEEIRMKWVAGRHFQVLAFSPCNLFSPPAQSTKQGHPFPI